MQFHVKLSLLLAFLLLAGSATANETLESILAIAAKQQNTSIDYREVRHLQLLNGPWQAQGRMFVTASVFVMEQLAPQRQLLTANKHRFWLYVPDKNIRRTGMVTTPMAQRNFALFKPIMHGDKKALEKEFDIHFTSTDAQWLLELEPKRANNTLYSRISVKGKNGHAAEYMKAEMPDGDFTEWFFQQQHFSSTTEKQVIKLMHEAKGK